MTNLTPIILAVITLVFAAIAAFVIPWLKKKLSKEDMDAMLQLIQIAVRAAQQMYYAEGGDVRLKYVMDFLAAQGYDVDDEAIRAAIEAEVLALHQALVGDSE